jgi:hypothetical protein
VSIGIHTNDIYKKLLAEKFGEEQVAANNPSGGTSIVTFGLIIAGAVRGFRGLSKS